jgi:hypothetical protein
MSSRQISTYRLVSPSAFESGEGSLRCYIVVSAGARMRLLVTQRNQCEFVNAPPQGWNKLGVATRKRRSPESVDRTMFSTPKVHVGGSTHWSSPFRCRSHSEIRPEPMRSARASRPGPFDSKVRAERFDTAATRTESLAYDRSREKVAADKIEKHLNGSGPLSSLFAIACRCYVDVNHRYFTPLHLYSGRALQ